MFCRVYDLNTLKQYKFVVVLSIHNGNFLLSRHKKRLTWETQGGHIEYGETPLEAAKRELFEESGAIEYEISALFDYWCDDGEGTGAGGMVFLAKIFKLGELPDSEMAEVREFKTLPRNLTYPEITPVLFKELEKVM